ncbi:leucine-rich repeat-containing protein [Tanacetum coccineum]
MSPIPSSHNIILQFFNGYKVKCHLLAVQMLKFILQANESYVLSLLPIILLVPIHPNSSLFNLPHLQTLNLASNNFTGSQIPSEIGRFSNSLTHLNLSDCRFSGQVPMDITLLHKLVSLDLNDDLKLEPHVFINIGNVPFESFALPSLTLLDLTHNNQLSGQIDMQTFRQLTNLTHLDLSFNNFSGEWELDTLLSSLKNLEYLDLSYNGFSVTTNNANHYVNPGFLFLKLASCKLKVFPESFRAMKQLQELDLSGNEIHGHIPHWAGEIGRNELSLLNLSYNFIKGLPQFQCDSTMCGKYQQLSYDDGFGEQSLSRNRAVSLILVALCRDLPSLQALVLKSNNFHGNIQPSFAVKSPFPGLQVLDLSRNRFVGQLPTKYFQNFNSMKNVVLVLKSNNFHGNIQPSFAVKSPFPVYYVWQERNRKLFNNCKKSVDLFGILYEEIRAKMVSITVKQTAKVLRAETVWNIKLLESKMFIRFRVMPLMDASLPYCEVAAAVRVDCLHEGNWLTGESMKKYEKFCTYGMLSVSFAIFCFDVFVSGFAADVDFGDEDDSDTEEEVKEEEAIGKLAPPVSNQVEATT